MEGFDPENPPVPDPRANHGRRSSHAEKRLLGIDHLAPVASISVGQIKKPEKAGIRTVARSAQSRHRVISERLRYPAALQTHIQTDSRGGSISRNHGKTDKQAPGAVDRAVPHRPAEGGAPAEIFSTLTAVTLYSGVFV